MTDEADRYERGSEIARGGMGRVIEAVDRRLGRTVAIKEILTADVASRRRFEREVSITARLEHPSIVPVHDSGEWKDGEPFYVMRKVSGRPLDEMITAAGTLDARLTLLPHMAAVVDAIAHAHGRGIVHRDLKPANVLVGEHGETLVIDWGLAKVIGEADPEPVPGAAAGGDGMTRAGEVVGTPGFMAPEQALAEGVDARTDVFALGACLYQLLAGKPPFHGASETEVLDRTVAEAPARLTGVVAGVPPDLVAIVEKAMAIDPVARYPDAAGLRDDLRRFLAGQLVAAHHYSPAQRVGRAIRRYRAVIAVAVLALAVVITVGVLALRRMFADRDRIALARTAAVDALARERERADELVVAQATALVSSDPTLAIATLKQLAPQSPAWDRARPVVATARDAGIARGYRAGGGEPARAALGPDNLLVTTAGTEVWVHDLTARTSRQIGTTARWIAVIGWAARSVVWRDDSDDASQRVHVVDVDTGVTRTLAWPEQIQSMSMAPDGEVAFCDNSGRGFVMDTTAATLAPVEVPVPERADAVTVSPSGRWLVVPAERHTFVFRRDPGTGTGWTAAGSIAGSILLPKLDADETRLGGLVVPTVNDHTDWPAVVEADLGATVIERQRRTGMHMVDVFYARGDLVGLAVDQTIVDTSTGKRVPWDNGAGPHFGRLVPAPRETGWVFFDATNRIVVQRGPTRSYIVPPAQVDLVVTSPSSPYLVALSRGVVLVWNIDETLPIVAPADSAGLLAFVDRDTAITTQTATDGYVLIGHDLAAGATRTGPKVPFSVTLHGIRDDVMVAIDRGSPGVAWLDATIDKAHPIPIARASAAVARDAGHLAVATLDGVISDYDRTTGAVTELARLPTMTDLNAVEQWIAVRTEDGGVWRRSPDGKVDQLTPDPPARAISIDTDGEVVIAQRGGFVVWPVTGPARSLAADAMVVDPVEVLHLPGKRAAVVTADTAVAVLDLRTGALRPAVAACGNGAQLAEDGMLAAAVCQGRIEVTDLATGDTFSLTDIVGGNVGSIAVSSDGEWLAAIAGVEPYGGMLVAWHLGLPRGPALAAWVAASTNAIAPHAGKIEWQ